MTRPSGGPITNKPSSSPTTKDDGQTDQKSPSTSTPTTPSLRRHPKTSAPPSTLTSPPSQAVPNPRSNSPTSSRSPMVPNNRGKLKDGGTMDLRPGPQQGRRRRSFHVSNNERMDDHHKTSEARSTTSDRPSHQTGRPVSPSQHRGGRDRPSEVFVKVSSAGSKTRGGVGRSRRGDDNDDGRVREVISESDSRPRSDSRRSPNNQGMRQRGGSSAGPDDRRSYSNNGATVGSNTRNFLRDSAPPSDERPAPVVLKYSVEELRHLRYSPAANRKPSGLHSSIDRTKSSPLILCPRVVSKPQPAGPSRSRRTPEQWGTVPRRDSFGLTVDNNDGSATETPDPTVTPDPFMAERIESQKSEKENLGELNSSPPPATSVVEKTEIQQQPHKSTMGSADVAPFVPRQQLDHILKTVNNPGLEDWEKTHYEHYAAISPNRASHVPSVEIQKDPAISSYGFNPSNQMKPELGYMGHGAHNNLMQQRGYEMDGMNAAAYGGRQMDRRIRNGFDEAGAEEDLWDAPIGDTNDIFTLGDIRAASDGRSHGQSPNPNFQPQRDSPQEQPMNVFSDNGLFFEDEEDGDGSNGGSTFIRNIFRAGYDGTSARPPPQRTQSKQGTEAALEALLSPQLAGGVGLPQQPNLRLKLEAWAKSKGHQGLAELLVHQQRVAQQRATAQQQGARPPMPADLRPGMPRMAEHIPDFPNQQMPSEQQAAPGVATNALLQVLQRHNLSSEQAMGLARVIQQQPHLVGSLLESLRQRQPQQQQQHPVMLQQARPTQPPQLQPVQPQAQQAQQAALLNMVRQKLLAAQATQGKPNAQLQQQQPGVSQQQQPMYNIPAAIQQQLQQLGQQQQQQQQQIQQLGQNGNQASAAAAANLLASKIAAARAGNNGQVPPKYMESILAMAQQQAQERQASNQPIQQPYPARVQEIQRIVQQLQLSAQQGNPQLQQLLQRQLQQLLQQHQQQQQMQQHDQLQQLQHQQLQQQQLQQQQVQQQLQQQQLQQQQLQQQQLQQQQLHQQQQHQQGSLNLQQLAQAARILLLQQQQQGGPTTQSRQGGLAAQLASLPPAQQQQLAAHLLNLQRQQQQQRDVTSSATPAESNVASLDGWTGANLAPSNRNESDCPGSSSTETAVDVEGSAGAGLVTSGLNESNTDTGVTEAPTTEQESHSPPSETASAATSVQVSTSNPISSSADSAPTEN